MIRIRSTFLKNWLALASADLISQALSFFSMFQVARHLALEGYGLFVVARFLGDHGQVWTRMLIVGAAAGAACYWFRDNIELITARLLTRDSSTTHSEA
jgi:hypothetical protein